MKSQVIFESPYYVVCLIQLGLTVQNKSTGKGKLLPKDAPNFKDWFEAFHFAIDKTEMRDLAKAFLQN